MGAGEAGWIEHLGLRMNEPQACIPVLGPITEAFKPLGKRSRTQTNNLSFIQQCAVSNTSDTFGGGGFSEFVTSSKSMTFADEQQVAPHIAISPLNLANLAGEMSV